MCVFAGDNLSLSFSGRLQIKGESSSKLEVDDEQQHQQPPAVVRITLLLNHWQMALDKEKSASDQRESEREREITCQWMESTTNTHTHLAFVVVNIADSTVVVMELLRAATATAEVAAVDK